MPDVRAPILAALQAQLEEVIRRSPEPGLADGIHHALELPTLAEHAIGRLDGVGKERLTGFVALAPRAEYVERAITLYVGSGDYNTANYIADNLILSLAPFIRAEHALQIDAVARERNSQVGGGRRFAAVKARLQDLGVWPPQEPQE